VIPAGTPVQLAATEVRDAIGVSATQPIEHLTHLAERAGVPVIMRGVPGNLSLHRADEAISHVMVERHLGYSVRVGEHGDRPITVLRAVPSWERIRWTIAHELGHICMHGSTLSSNSEEEASRFASELIAPAAAIAEELPPHITLASLTPIKLRWGISLGALILHLAHNSMIDDSRLDTLRRQLYTRTNPSTGRTWGRDEPGWDAREVERPRLLSTWLERCIGYSVAPAVAQIFGLFPADVIGLMLSGQRTGKSINKGGQNSRRSGRVDSAVVSLDEWRLRQAE
jgi:Zn-dependent peptidase ImmA (M78 family)